MLGATDTELADFFGVTEQTLNNWKKSKDGFFEALKAGKSMADAQVASRLYERATGYSHAEDKVFVNNGEVIVVPTTRHYPPDSTAAIFWLKNRQPARWRDKHELGHDVVGTLEEFLRDVSGSQRGSPMGRLADKRRSDDQ